MNQKKAAAQENSERLVDIYRKIFRGMIDRASVEILNYDYEADKQRLLDEFPNDRSAIIKGEIEAQK